MSTFKRGGVWWYEFQFLGQRIRESTHSRSESMAIKAEREKRHQMENGANHVKDVKRPAFFAAVAKQWLATNPHWAPRTLEANELKMRSVLPYFGKLQLVDINGDDVARYQVKRLKERASPRTVNMEVGLLRQVMRKSRLWANIQPDIKML